MSPADRIALLTFLLVLCAGILAVLALRLFRKTERELSLERLKQLTGRAEANDASTIAETERRRREAQRRKLRESLGFFGMYLARMEVLAGPKGVRRLLIGMPTVMLLAWVINWKVLNFPLWVEAAILILAPVLVGVAAHRAMVTRFQTAFLNQLPEVLDSLTRASQAGVPVTLAIRTVGDIYEWPVGPEFRRIGTALQLGNDLSAVLDEAELRIRLPDFSFFAVCLMLQRETGGPLSAALNNLSALLRERRDLRLKARAMTAEARLTSKLIGAIPILMLGMMWLTNRDYVSVLFETPAGNLILVIAAIMLSIGLFAVNRLAKLKT